MNDMTEPCFPLLSIVRLRMGSDGDGITSLVAGAGCPLDCRWCINKRVLRELKPEMVSPSHLLEKVMIDDLYFQATGGGITFGGGESLLHTAFIKNFRELCPDVWRICAETSLYVDKELLSLSLQAVDDYSVDCKDLDKARYYRYTGGDASLLHENLAFLLHEAGPDRIHIRVPYIPEFNTRKDQEDNARILKKMGFSRIELFDYVIRKDTFI